MSPPAHLVCCERPTDSGEQQVADEAEVKYCQRADSKPTSADTNAKIITLMFVD